MTLFGKAAIAVVLTVILGTVIERTDRDISTVLTVTGCCLVMIASMHYLTDIIDFILIISQKLESYKPYTVILLRITGIALIAELITHISADAGNTSLGKAFQFLGNSVMLSLSLPLLEGFVLMIQDILGNI